MATSPVSPKKNGHGLITSPFDLKGIGMDASPFSLKENGILYKEDWSWDGHLSVLSKEER